MSFGEIFGNLVKTRRGIEGMTQQALAVAAFGDESYKTRISELENGKVAKPHPKTVDAIAVALGISDETINGLLNQQAHPLIYDNICDFFHLDGERTMDFEVAANDKGKAVFFHDRRIRSDVKRAELFVEESTLVILDKDGRRRPFGCELPPALATSLKKCNEMLFIRVDPITKNNVQGESCPLKIIL